MTRRTLLSVASLLLSGLILTGCSAESSAVFQALLDPPPAASGEGSSGEPGSTLSSVSTWWAHPHGYAMSLPPGWVAIDLDASSTEQLLSALGTTFPGVAQRIRDVLSATGAQGSMLAVDLGADPDAPPVMIVVARDTGGIRPRQLKALVEEELSRLPGLRGTPMRTDERRNDAGSLRFDYAIDDPDLGALRVRSSLYRYGGQAYIVSFVAPESELDEARPDFEAIVASLRFGI
jgi:hypothetical protein